MIGFWFSFLLDFMDVFLVGDLEFIGYVIGFILLILWFLICWKWFYMWGFKVVFFVDFYISLRFEFLFRLF